MEGNINLALKTLNVNALNNPTKQKSNRFHKTKTLQAVAYNKHILKNQETYTK